MEILPQKYPEVYNQFLAGKHTVSRAKDDSAFNTVATDMTLEQIWIEIHRQKVHFFYFCFLKTFFPKELVFNKDIALQF